MMPLGFDACCQGNNSINTAQHILARRHTTLAMNTGKYASIFKLNKHTHTLSLTPRDTPTHTHVPSEGIISSAKVKVWKRPKNQNVKEKNEMWKLNWTRKEVWKCVFLFFFVMVFSLKCITYKIRTIRAWARTHTLTYVHALHNYVSYAHKNCISKNLCGGYGSLETVLAKSQHSLQCWKEEGTFHIFLESRPKLKKGIKRPIKVDLLKIFFQGQKYLDFLIDFSRTFQIMNVDFLNRFFKEPSNKKTWIF